MHLTNIYTDSFKLMGLFTDFIGIIILITFLQERLDSDFDNQLRESEVT